QTPNGINWFAGVTDTIEAGDPPGVALPLAQTGDIKLAVVWIEARAHAGGSEAERKFHDAALHPAIRELLLQHEKEARFAVGFMEHFALIRSPSFARDPNLTATRIIKI